MSTKLYRKIDNDGYFVEDVLLKEVPFHYDDEFNKIYNPNYISLEVPEGLYKPKWDGSKWVEGLLEEDINSLRNNTKQSLEMKNRADIDYLSIMMGVDL